MLEKHFQDPRWREVILIVASYLPNAERFIETQAKILINSQIYKLYAPYLRKILSYAKAEIQTGLDGGEYLITTLGLKEAKDAVEVITNRENELSVKLGAKKIEQIKAVRSIGRIYELQNRLLESLFDEFRNLVKGPILSFTDAELQEIIDQFGSSPFDKFWVDYYSILQRSLELFVECCGRDTILSSEFRKNIIRLVFNPIFNNSA